MQPIFGLLYTVLFFSYIATALFVVFHIVRYSLKRSTAVFGVTLFLVVFGVLIFSNALIFFSLPFNEMLPRSF
jgi:FtsH-binding integral membrane protein